MQNTSNASGVVREFTLTGDLEKIDTAVADLRRAIDAARHAGAPDIPVPPITVVLADVLDLGTVGLLRRRRRVRAEVRVSASAEWQPDRIVDYFRNIACA